MPSRDARGIFISIQNGSLGKSDAPQRPRQHTHQNMSLGAGSIPGGNGLRGVAESLLGGRLSALFYHQEITRSQTSASQIAVHKVALNLLAVVQSHP